MSKEKAAKELQWMKTFYENCRIDCKEQIFKSLEFGEYYRMHSRMLSKGAIKTKLRQTSQT